MNTRRFALALVLAALAALRCDAQITPTTADIITEIAPNGSVDLTFKLSFDAAAWRPWRAVVGDDPARLRAMFQHQFAAYTLENFKLERDDVNRTAKLTMHSPTGPDLRSDGSFQVPIEPYYRLVNGAGREWFFSGNNPNAGNTLNNVKIVLPLNAVDAAMANAGSSDQSLIFALRVAPGASRWLLLAGTLVGVLGAGLLVAGVLTKNRFPAPRLALAEPTRSQLPPPLPPEAPVRPRQDSVN